MRGEPKKNGATEAFTQREAIAVKRNICSKGEHESMFF